MAQTNWYQDWFNSEYYHKLYFERDDIEAQSFIQKLINRLQPPAGAAMLDVACGRGRHSKYLAAQGFNVTGIDISVDSIAAAKAAESENLQFFVHDMRLTFWVNYFDYAFNFFTSFGYFATRREHNDAVRTMAQSLNKNGVVLFDYLNVNYAVAHLKPEEEKTVGTTLYHIRRWHTPTHFFKEITVTDPDLNNPLVHTEQVAKFSFEDFNTMLKAQGLTITEVFGDYNLNPYDKTTAPRMVIVAKKSSV